MPWWLCCSAGSGRVAASALVLALAVCFKPIAVPIVLAVLLYLLGRSVGRALLYAGLSVAGVAAFYVAPFFVFGWGSAPLRRVNDEFVVNGGMSYMTVARLVHEPLLLAGHWWFLGLAWVPALAVTAALLRRGVSDLGELIRASTALVLVFFLTRTWLAEPNAVLIVLLALLLTSLGRLDRRALTALWVIPLLFTLLNASPLQLLWMAAPGAMASSLRFVAQYGHAMLVARAALVVAWQVTGWWVVVRCLKRAAVGAPQPAPGAQPAPAQPAPGAAPGA